MKVIPLYNNESKLIARAAGGKREAQQLLYERFSGKMLSVCRIYVKDLHHAEEVMLTGFLKVFTHLKDFKHEGSFEGWIRKIMVRESISFLRGKKELEFREEAIEDPNESFNSIQEDIDAEHIQQLIDSLPEGYKVVFVMYAIEGYKHHEIAQILKITSGTSKSQLFKARRMLQEKLRMQKSTDYGTTTV